MRLYNTYLGPASNALLDLGAAGTAWNNLFIGGTNSSSVLQSSSVNVTVLTATSATFVGVVATGLTVNTINAVITSTSLLRIGTGGIFRDVITANTIIDFPSVAGGTSTDMTIAVAGVTTLDAVILGVPGPVISGGSNCDNGAFFAYIPSSDAVTIRYVNNYTITAADPSSGTFHIVVLKA